MPPVRARPGAAAAAFGAMRGVSVEEMERMITEEDLDEIERKSVSRRSAPYAPRTYPTFKSVKPRSPETGLRRLREAEIGSETTRVLGAAKEDLSEMISIHFPVKGASTIGGISSPDAPWSIEIEASTMHDFELRVVMPVSQAFFADGRVIPWTLRGLHSWSSLGSLPEGVPIPARQFYCRSLAHPRDLFSSWGMDAEMSLGLMPGEFWISNGGVWVWIYSAWVRLLDVGSSDLNALRHKIGGAERRAVHAMSSTDMPMSSLEFEPIVMGRGIVVESDVDTEALERASSQRKKESDW